MMKPTLIRWAVPSLMLIAAVMLLLARQERPPGQIHGGHLTEAVQAYAQQLREQGRPVQGFVTLGELLRQGHLSERDVQGFEGMEVSVNLEAGESRPGEILVRVVAPDGQIFAALADGSVQSLRR